MEQKSNRREFAHTKGLSGVGRASEQLYIHLCIQKHIQHNRDEQTQFFRKIYLSLYWKGCVWEGVEDWTKTATYSPPNSSRYHSLSFLFSWTAQSGAWRPSLCRDMVLIPALSLQLIWTSCRRSYIIIWHPSTSCKRHNSHSIQPFDSQGYSLIPWYLRPDAPVIYTDAFLLLTAWPGLICNTNNSIKLKPFVYR